MSHHDEIYSQCYVLHKNEIHSHTKEKIIYRLKREKNIAIYGKGMIV